MIQGISKKFVSLLLVLLIFVNMMLTQLTFADEYAPSEDKISDFEESVLFDYEHFSATQKISVFKDGHFFVKEITDKTGTRAYTTSFYIPGNFLRVMYIDSANEVVQQDYSNGGTLPANSILMLKTDKMNVFLSQPYQLMERKEQGLLERQTGSCYITVEREGAYYRIFFYYPPNKGAKNIQWALVSANSLHDFNSESEKIRFKAIDLVDKGLLSYEGYLYEFHASKPPFRTYLLIPSPYMAKAFVFSGKSRLYNIMGQAMLKLAAENINEEGYFPVQAHSDWLYNDYGISAPYFDNRWNADLAITLMECAERWNDAQLRTAYQKLLSYFCSHVKERSYKTDNGGYLNYDYASSGKIIKTHMALNHQLAVISMFYKAYEINKNDTYKIYADRLLRGIESIGEKWLMPSKDLYYALLPDGNLGLKDYPTLTYNDMFTAQKLIEKNEGQPSSILTKLMSEKKIWMDTNGFKGKYFE